MTALADADRDRPHHVAGEARRDGELWRSISQLLAELADETATLDQGPGPAASVGSRTTTLVSLAPVASLVPMPAPAPTVADHAADLARVAFDVDLEHLIDTHGDAWAALVAAIRRRTSPFDTHIEDENEEMDTYSRLMAALPSDLRRDFRHFAESRALDSIVERQAAFELGRQIGRKAVASDR